MASLVPFLKKKILDPVEHAAGNVAHAGGNVVNALSAHNINRVAESNYNPTTLVKNLVVKPTVDWAASGVRSVYDIGRGAAASGDIPGTKLNPVALQNAHKAQQTDFSQFLPSRQLAQLAESIVHPTSQHTVTPQSEDDKKLFGTRPIQNIQAGVATNYAQHPNLNPAARIGLAGAYGTGQLAQDLLAAAGAKAGVKTLAKETKGLPVGLGTKKVDPAATHAELEKHAAEYFKNDAKATADYQAHTMQEFGVNKPNVVSADSAKFIVKGGKMDPHMSVPFHESASAFSKQYYKKLLDDPSTKDQPVMFTGGGSGAGKTYSLANTEGEALNNKAAIVDTNLTDVPGSVKKIGQALDSGRKVQIKFVYRDPVEAFRKGVLPRAEKTGRTVPIDVHTGTHVGSADTIQKLAEHYKNDPRVDIQIIHNGPNGPEVVPVDFLKDKGYNESKLKEVLHNELKQAHAQKEISQRTHDASRSDSLQSRQPSDNRRNGKSPTESAGPSDSKLAPPKKLSEVDSSERGNLNQLKKVKKAQFAEVKRLREQSKRGNIIDRGNVRVPLMLAKSKHAETVAAIRRTEQAIDARAKELGQTTKLSAEKDWEQNYADKTSKLDDQTTRLTQSLTTAKAKDKPIIQKKITELNNQSKALEDEFLSKHGTDPAVTGKPADPKVEKFTSDYADSLRQMESGFTGGQMIPDGAGGYKRTSEHSPFYRKFYAENKKAPTKADYLAEAKRQLESGKADSYAQKEFDDLKNPEVQSLLNAPKSYTAPDASIGVKTRRLEDPYLPDRKKLAPPKRSTKEDAPVPVKDLLKNKQAELKAKSAAATQPKQLPKSTDAGAAGYPPLPTKTAVKPNAGSSVQNKFTKGAKQGKQNVSPEVQAEVKGSHKVRNTKALQESAVAKADSAGIDKTIADAHTALQKPLGKIDDKVVADAQQAIERADAAGRTEDAVNLHDQLSEHLTKQGQSIQAASLFYKLSPQGQLYKAMRDIRKADSTGKTLTPELESKLRIQVDDIKKAEPGEAKDRAQAVFQKTVRDNIPASKINGVLSVWKAGLLSGVKTHTGNALSNGVFGLLKKLSDIPSAGIDTAISAVTGKRSKVFTTRGVGSGAAKGGKLGVETLRTGIDMRNMAAGGKYDGHGELNFKNPVINAVFAKPSNLVFRAMNAGDQPFYYAAAKNTLNDLAITEAKNKGLRGAERESFVQNFVKNPTTKAAETAKAAAEKAVLGQDSKFAANLSHLAQEHPAVQVLVPFIKVPTNFLTRTLDYTPVGYVKAFVKKGIRPGKGFDQRAFSEALGEATTGSAVLYMGAELAKNSLLSGAYPTDAKEQQRWKAQGIQPNSVKVGNKWISLNYLGPMGLLLGAGKEFHDAAGQGNNGYTQALASFGKNLAGQSFLSGFSSFANALTDPGRYLDNLKKSEASSLVPSWANDLANLTDKYQRQAGGATDAIKAKIPGLRKGLPVKTDVYGNGLDQRASPGRLTADPLRPSNDITNKNPVVAEVSRLHGVNPNNSDLQVTPTPPTSLNVEGKTVKLSDSQKYELNNLVGKQIQDNWGKLIKTSEYKALSDIDKAKALSNLRSDTTTLAERQYVVDNNLGTYTKSPDRSVQALGQGQSVLGDYATNTQKSGASGVVLNKDLDSISRGFLTKYNAMSADQRKQQTYSTPDYEYKVLQAQYANNQANKSLSTAQNIAAQDKLAKAKIGSTYSKDVRELYGLTKDEITGFVTTDKNGQKYADQLKAYDQALYDAGITNSLKFKNGFTTTKRAGSGTKFRVASIPSIKSTGIKTPRLRTPKAKMASLKGVPKARYTTKKIQTNANRKLQVSKA